MAKKITKEDFFNQLNSCKSGKEYIDLVTNPINNITGRGDRHHIHPVSLGSTPGFKEKDNIIKLSFFNHIKAHVLLAKAAIELNANWKYEVLMPLTEFSRAQINELSDVEKITLENILEWSKLLDIARKEHGKKCKKIYDKKSPEEKAAIIRKRKETNDKKSPEEKAEIRRKLSEANKGEKNGFYGKTFTEEQRKHLREVHLGKPSAMKGKHHSEETRAKLKEARKKRVNRPCSEETKLKLSLSNKGKKRTEEQKKYIRLKTKESLSNISPEAKERMKTMKGKHWSEEHKKHLSEILKGKKHDYSNTDTSKMGKAMLGKHHTDEVKLKLSQKTKGLIFMTKPGDKVRYVIPEKQSEFIANGYYRCHRNGTPWEEKVA